MNISKELLIAIAEIQQSRSNYQIDNFVINQHDTDEMQYYQILLEINDLLYKYKRTILEIKKIETKIVNLKNSNNEIDTIDAEILQLDLGQSKLSLLGAERELEYLINLWENFDKKYSREEIEKNQREYWNKRLTRQASLQAMGQGYIDWSQIDALRQAGILDEFINNKKIEEIE